MPEKHEIKSDPEIIISLILHFKGTLIFPECKGILQKQSMTKTLTYWAQARKIGVSRKKHIAENRDNGAQLLSV